jgi:hypothetical protein
MTIVIKWFPPPWIQIKSRNLIIYIDPAYLKTYFTRYPQKKLGTRSEFRVKPLQFGEEYHLNYFAGL